jgi:hypothetical protein
MEAQPAAASHGAAPHEGAPAPWTKSLVRLDALWTKVETYLVLGVLIAAILYMTGWVTLNAFHTKGGKLANFPGIILVFTGLAAAASWTRIPPAERLPKKLILPGVLFLLGIILLLVAKKQDYFANVSRWLADASLIKQMGTPQIVSARLFTIWVALLGGSLATGAGRQINIDVVMRFIGPRPRLIVALLGYVMAATACFVIAWGFVDYLAITRYGAAKTATVGEKLGFVGKSVGRHSFLVRRQMALDLRSFGKVVLAGQPFDKWYTGAEWNEELNQKGWADVYPPSAPAAGSTPPAIPYPTKPCLSQKEMEELSAKGASLNPDWRLTGSCDIGDGTGTRAPLATAPEPDDRTPLEADLSLLFPWGFFMIGLRFVLRGLLAFGGAVSTDPNAAHGADAPVHGPPIVAIEPPIVERRVDQEAKAHAGEDALPPDDIHVGDALGAAKAKVDAGADDADNEKKDLGGERPHHDVADVAKPAIDSWMMAPAAEKAPSVPPTKPSSIPPPDVPTAPKLEIAQQIADEEEEERTLVGDLSELAKAQELIELQNKIREEEKKKGGKG